MRNYRQYFLSERCECDIVIRVFATNGFYTLTVDQISNHFFITRRTFERRFKKATRHTVAEYIQRVKIEATKKRLEIGRKTINEIMYEVGYSDIQGFRGLFK